MPTSSIIEDIRVNNPKAIEAFVKAMESSAENYHIRKDSERSTLVTDPERIRRFMQKCLEKSGVEKY